MNFSIKRLTSARLFSWNATLHTADQHGAFHVWLARVVPDHLLARRRWLRLVGWPGVLAAVVLAACPAFYALAIHPARVRMEDARTGALSMQQRVAIAERGLGRADLPPAEQLVQFYRIFPQERNLLPWLKKVFELAAAQGIRLDEGKYTLVRDRMGRLARFQMTLPVRSRYPQIRNYLNTLREDIPFLALEHLQFQRRKVSDAQVEAKLTLALYVEEAQ